MDINKENGAFSEFLTLEDFKTWSAMALKMFLSLRNKSVNGSIDVLAGRFVYCSSFLFFVFEVVFFVLFEKFSLFCFQLQVDKPDEVRQSNSSAK